MPTLPVQPSPAAPRTRLEAAADGGAGGQRAIFYQPIYSLRDELVVSVEALVRWRLDSGLVLGAAQVLAAADSPEDCLTLDLAVLRQASADMIVLLDEHREVGLHGLNVNLTASSLVNPGLDIAVLQVLEETGLPPTSLRLEVPETAALTDLTRATAALRRLTATGIALTLDDVGVQAVGLRYLRSLAIDGLKLDRSFVTRMLNGASDLTVVRLLVDLCAGLEIRLTAEGVERCEQLQVARSLGVRAIQGNHVARPMPLERLQEFLRRGVEHVCDSCFGPAPSVNQRLAAAPAE
jgi:EAL domain-containing protein (putative c-di-GMP-specific phosphodiesterase class I)